MKLLFHTWLFFLLGNLTLLYAQGPLSLGREVDTLLKRNDARYRPGLETIVFTGSSSIRLWADLSGRFPGYQIINSGFGGSTAADLVQYYEDLILRYQPAIAVIYEGDNDIYRGRNPGAVLRDLRRTVTRLHQQDPGLYILLLSCKPSPKRWSHKNKYLRLNRRIEHLCQKHTNLAYVDVWTPMLGEDAVVRTELFKEDGLHLNPEGYQLWYELLLPYIISIPDL